ncbi:MAG: class II fructose-bisphosphate aldolase [Prolixibacteraceae bacterium]|jgi:fructose/tagatose bisphosphate aldolase|nr:class II fructose-bisphosphate aldolase [Prolixibacteraceae bacterium]
MSLILERNKVLDVYQEAARKKWVIPTFNTENLTNTEAILAAALEYSQLINQPDIPVTIGITNQYSHRSQSVYYTHTRRWDIGLKLFLADIGVLTSKGSPYENLRVMIHLDHAQWDTDKPLLAWDMDQFSMIMYDASNLPFEENIRLTAKFVQENGHKIVIEGACDEIVDATGDERSSLTTPEQAIQYLTQTKADFIVANLGTEHRASASDLKYHGDMAREISKLTGPKLVLHGTSSVGNDQVKNLFTDGIAKVNIWTIMERDSSPVLFEDMVKNASNVIGKEKTEAMIESGLLGKNVLRSAKASLSHYTTAYRQDIVFGEMKKIVLEYLKLWYV